MFMWVACENQYGTWNESGDVQFGLWEVMCCTLVNSCDYLRIKFSKCSYNVYNVYKWLLAPYDTNS